MSTAAEVYAELLAGTPVKPGRSYRAFRSPDGLQTRAFVDGPSRLPGLTIRASRDRIPPGMQLPRITGAEITISQPDGEGAAATVVYELRSAGPAYTQIFVELAARLITSIRDEPAAEAALLRVTHQVNAWARFFDARGVDGLGRSAQIGLIGELICLERLAALDSFPAAVRAWTGPGGTPHDFEWSGGAIEVKLTTSSMPERFRIASERQLDDSEVPWLALFAIVAQESEAGATNLPGVVDRIRSALIAYAPPVVTLFEERLLGTGYADIDRNRYDVRITTTSAEFLHVAGDFPRIRPVELRSGVFGVSYYIPWSAIAPYRVLESDVRRAFCVAE